MQRLPESSQDVRQRLLEAAIHLFAEKGYSGVGIRDIAQRAQANSAMVQYHFGGKEGLYLATMHFLFEQGHDAISSLEPPPSPEEEGAFPRAIVCLEAYIRAFLEEVFACHAGEYCSPEMQAAAQLFLTRELLDPRPGSSEIILGHIRPHVDYINACLLVLRPDLDEEARFLAGSSIQAQVSIHFQHRAVVGLLRGVPYGPQDIGKLTAHITEFSLRGLGLGDTHRGA